MNIKEYTRKVNKAKLDSPELKELRKKELKLDVASAKVRMEMATIEARIKNEIIKQILSHEVG